MLVNTEEKIDASIDLPDSILKGSKGFTEERFWKNYFDYLKGKSVIIFSPHFDDAVLSAGSLISGLLDNQIPVTVITVFTEATSGISSNSTRTILKRAGFENAKEYYEARKNEDLKALKKLGEEIKTVRLGYTDGAWRNGKNKPFYPNGQLVPVAPSDKDTIDLLKNGFYTYRDRANIILAPLAVGGHVDHKLVRNAAVETFKDVIFYRDFPYSAYSGDDKDFISQNGLKAVEWHGKYLKKKEAILSYETQRVSLFYRGRLRLPYEKFFFKKTVA